MKSTILLLLIFFASVSSPLLAQQTITITSPTESASFNDPGSITINWTTSGFTSGNVSIEYSIDGGTTWRQLFVRAYNLGTINWTSPDLPSGINGTVKLRIKDSPGGTISDTKTFTITSSNPRTLSIASPTVGSTLTGAATINIDIAYANWVANDYVSLYYSLDGGANYASISLPQFTTSSGTKSVSWLVYDRPTTQLMFKVQGYNSNLLFVATSGLCTISSPTPWGFAFTSPLAGQTLAANQATNVTWNAQNLSDAPIGVKSVYFEVSYDNGVNWADPAGESSSFDASLVGTQSWTPNQTSNTVKVRLRQTDQVLKHESAVFKVAATIPNAVVISNPAGTEQVKFSTTQEVKWLNTGTFASTDTYYLYYSNDGGAFISIGAFYGSQLTASGNYYSYNWTVPDFGNDLDSQVKIRVWNQTKNVSDTSEAFRVYYQPSVAVTSPINTDQSKFSTQKTISWTNGDRKTTDTYYLYYSNDGGAFTSIGAFYGSQLTEVDNVLSYTWTIPDFGNDLDSQIKIRVWNQTRNKSDTSQAFRVYYQPSIAVTAPISTDQSKFSTQRTISWTNGDRKTTDTYYLYYSNDGGAFTSIGAFYGSQLTEVGNELSYSWTVPDFGNDLDSQIKIRVWNQTRNKSDTSKAFRVYYQPSVKIKSPSAGEYVLQGGKKNILWRNGDQKTTDTYYLYYSNNGAAFTSIGAFYGSQLTASGDSLSYNWTVPAIASTNVKLRVWNQTRNKSDTTLSFTICTSCPIFTVVTPNGGESYTPGQTVAVTWTLGNAWDATDQIDIMYSANGGTSYTGTIFSGAYSGITSNSVNWTVPTTEAITYKIRIRNTTKGYSDESDLNFKVSNTLKSPTSFFAKQNTNGTITFTWQDPNASETGHRVEYSSNRTTWTNYSGTLAANAVTYTSEPIASGVAYWWRVVATSTTSTAASDLRYAGNIVAQGNSLAFDGTDDFVALQDSTLFDFGTGNFTVETWFKTSNITAAQSLINNYNGNIGEYFILFVQAGQIRAAIASNSYEIATPTIIENNKWYHVAMVRSGDRVTIYVNGSLQVTTTGFISRSGSSSGPILLGKQGSSNNFFLTGEMDEVRIWNTARSTSLISDNFQKILMGDEAGLLAYYRFDHTGTETLLADYAPYNFTGAWNGASAGTTTPKWNASGAFTILNPSITLTAPNGGGSYQIGTTISVTFTATDIATTDLLYLDYSADGGAQWTNIKSQLLSAGTTISWPTGGQNLVAGANYKVRVRNESSSVVAASEAAFTLTPAGTITLTTPNGGENWKATSSHAITWTMTNINASHLIEIRLSLNDGQTYGIQSSGTFGQYANNTYQWIVPELLTTQAKIQIVNTTLNVSDASDAVFTIAAGPDVTAPSFTTVPTVTIDGNSFKSTIALNEYSRVYLVALADGKTVPTAAQMKDAAKGTTPLDGQVAKAELLYTTVGQPADVTGTGTFVLNQLYDFYLAAEDTLGNLNAGVSRANVVRTCIPIECDSITLRNIYAEMDGSKWTPAYNWTTAKISQWTGVKVEGSRVTELSLASSAVTGTLSSLVLQLDALKVLNVSTNDLINVPNLTSLKNLTTLNISTNRLHFDDIEPNKGITGIVYSPQKKFDTPISVRQVKGTSFQKTVPVGGSQNTYVWKQTNDSLKAVTVTTLTTNQLSIGFLDFASQGKYVLEVTNTLVPGLTLTSETFEVLGTADLIFSAIGKNNLTLTEGFGYALKMRGKGLPFDSIPRITLSNGQFFFDNLVLGDYLIATESDPIDYIPTYYKNTYLWEQADTLRLRADQSGTLQMTFIPDPLGPDDGDNNVAGFVESDFADEEDGGRLLARRKVSKAGCSMRKFKGSGRVGQDEDPWELIAYIQTNDEGQFVFDFLPDGLYRFNIEYPGIPMDPNSFVEFEIGAGVDGSKLVLEAYITEDGIQVLKIEQLGFFKKYFSGLSVYPNPASDVLHIRYDKLNNDQTVARLLDMQGRLVKETAVTQGQNGEIILEVADLPNGLYLLNFIDTQSPSKAIVAYKVFVRH